MKKLLRMLGIAFVVMILMSSSVFADESLQPIDSYSDYGYDGATFSQFAQGYHSQLDTATDEEYETVIEYFVDSPDIVQGFETYKRFRTSEDAFIQYGPYTLYETGTGDARIYQVMQYESGYYVIVCGFDSTLAFNYLNFYKVDNLTADDNMPATFDIFTYELSELSGNSGLFFVFDSEILLGALRNTVIGLGVVFAVLILFTIIISLFKYISPEGRAYKEQMDFLEKSNETVTTAPVATANADNEMIAAITAAVVTDETQLVAAIVAAISAYEGVSSDSFVVKTIKKRKW